MLTNRTNILKATADETRLRLLSLLSQGERTVKDMTEILGQSQPRISRHLKLLADAHVIERAPEGAWVYYRLSDDATVRSIVEPMLAGLADSDLTIRRDSEQLERIKQRNQDAASAYFAAHAEHWDKVRNLHVPDTDIESAILEAAGPGPFHALLDIGTGTGRMLELFATRAARATGIDMSPAMLAVARSNLERAGHSHVQVRTGDANNLAVVRESFDLVLIHQVLHYLDDPARAIAQAAQTLLPGGRLLVIDFAPHSIEELRASHAHRRLGFSHKQIAQWLSDAGLTPETPTDLPPRDRSHEALTVSLFPARATASEKRLGLAGESRTP
jgi:ArsR family transcriptional regulator